MNSILQTDSYKVGGHYAQYPPGTETIYSYFESRHGALWPETVFFGLQYILKRHLEGQRISRAGINEARTLLAQHFGRNLLHEEGFTHILRDHGGRWPVSIKAVREGTRIPTGNVLMTVENTCPRCAWVTNYLETVLCQAWYPSSVATLSYQARQRILKYLEATGDPALIDFKLHDFGFRGSTSSESAAIGGAAHLVNFKGTDTLAALVLLRDYYDEPCAGHSIPASEHSTITSWGWEHERDAYANMLAVYRDGMFACVSDSYDIGHAVSQIWGSELKEQVLARNGTLVVRPDSGHPPTVVVDVVTRLGAAFGYTTNSKGYRVLDPHVRVIQGDGCTLDTIEYCLQALQVVGWSADNVAFGMGGGLLQSVNRDTQRFAFKCSYVAGINYEAATDRITPWERDVYKAPVGDPSKNSKRGKLALVLTDEGYRTVPAGHITDTENQLVEVFRDGALVRPTNLASVRMLAAEQ